MAHATGERMPRQRRRAAARRAAPRRVVTQQGGIGGHTVIRRRVRVNPAPVRAKPHYGVGRAVQKGAVQGRHRVQAQQRNARKQAQGGTMRLRMGHKLLSGRPAAELIVRSRQEKARLVGKMAHDLADPKKNPSAPTVPYYLRPHNLRKAYLGTPAKDRPQLERQLGRQAASYQTQADRYVVGHMKAASRQVDAMNARDEAAKDSGLRKFIGGRLGYQKAIRRAVWAPLGRSLTAQDPQTKLMQTQEKDAIRKGVSAYKKYLGGPGKAQQQLGAGGLLTKPAKAVGHHGLDALAAAGHTTGSGGRAVAKYVRAPKKEQILFETALDPTMYAGGEFTAPIRYGARAAKAAEKVSRYERGAKLLSSPEVRTAYRHAARNSDAKELHALLSRYAKELRASGAKAGKRQGDAIATQAFRESQATLRGGPTLVRKVRRGGKLRTKRVALPGREVQTATRAISHQAIKSLRGRGFELRLGGSGKLFGHPLQLRVPVRTPNRWPVPVRGLNQVERKALAKERAAEEVRREFEPQIARLEKLRRDSPGPHLDEQLRHLKRGLESELTKAVARTTKPLRFEPAAARNARRFDQQTARGLQLQSGRLARATTGRINDMMETAVEPLGHKYPRYKNFDEAIGRVHYRMLLEEAHIPPELIQKLALHSPEEEHTAQNLRKAYDELLRQGREHHVLAEGREKYAPRHWEHEAALDDLFDAVPGPRGGAGKPAYTKQRRYASVFDRADPNKVTLDLMRLFKLEEPEARQIAERLHGAGQQRTSAEFAARQVQRGHELDLDRDFGGFPRLQQSIRDWAGEHGVFKDPHAHESKIFLRDDIVAAAEGDDRALTERLKKAGAREEGIPDTAELGRPLRGREAKHAAINDLAHATGLRDAAIAGGDHGLARDYDHWIERLDRELHGDQVHPTELGAQIEYSPEVQARLAKVKATHAVDETDVKGLEEVLNWIKPEYKQLSTEQGPLRWRIVTREEAGGTGLGANYSPETHQIKYVKNPETNELADIAHRGKESPYFKNVRLRIIHELGHAHMLQTGHPLGELHRAVHSTRSATLRLGKATQDTGYSPLRGGVSQATRDARAAEIRDAQVQGELNRQRNEPWRTHNLTGENANVRTTNPNDPVTGVEHEVRGPLDVKLKAMRTNLIDTLRMSEQRLLRDKRGKPVVPPTQPVEQSLGDLVVHGRHTSQALQVKFSDEEKKIIARLATLERNPAYETQRARDGLQKFISDETSARYAELLSINPNNFRRAVGERTYDWFTNDVFRVQIGSLRPTRAITAHTDLIVNRDAILYAREKAAREARYENTAIGHQPAKRGYGYITDEGKVVTWTEHPDPLETMDHAEMAGHRGEVPDYSFYITEKGTIEALRGGSGTRLFEGTFRAAGEEMPGWVTGRIEKVFGPGEWDARGRYWPEDAAGGNVVASVPDGHPETHELEASAHQDPFEGGPGGLLPDTRATNGSYPIINPLETAFYRSTSQGRVVAYTNQWQAYDEHAGKFINQLRHDGSNYYDPHTGERYIPPVINNQDLSHIVGEGRLWPAAMVREASAEFNRLHDFEEVLNHSASAMFERIMTRTRWGVTAPIPAFHIRNMSSDILKSLQADSGMLFHPTSWAMASYAAGGGRKARMTIPGLGIKAPMEDFLMFADAFGIRSNEMLTDFGRIVGQHPNLDVNTAQAIGRRFVRSTMQFGSRREDIMRQITFLQRMRRNGGDAADAMTYMMKHHFDYSDLNGFERRAMRNVFLFYTWYRKNIPLQLAELVRRPGFFAGVEHNYEAAAEGRHPVINNNWPKITGIPFLPNTSGELPTQIMKPDYLTEQIAALGLNWNGQSMYLGFGAPWADLGLLYPQGATRFYSMLNPLLSQGAPLALGALSLSAGKLTAVDPLTGRQLHTREASAMAEFLDKIGIQFSHNYKGEPTLPWWTNYLAGMVPGPNRLMSPFQPKSAVNKAKTGRALSGVVTGVSTNLYGTDPASRKLQGKNRVTKEYGVVTGILDSARGDDVGGERKATKRALRYFDRLPREVRYGVAKKMTPDRTKHKTHTPQEIIDSTRAALGARGGVSFVMPIVVNKGGKKKPRARRGGGAVGGSGYGPGANDSGSGLGEGY